MVISYSKYIKTPIYYNLNIKDFLKKTYKLLINGLDYIKRN